jgi:phosphoribosylaminoimidazole-succinocarboxamide synthase/phosphoribosylformylglycinamidine synthase
MSHTVEVLVYLKEGVLDTQGKAVRQSLLRLGFEELEEVRIGKYIRLALDARNKDEAKSLGEKMCSELLVNELIEDFEVKVVD